MTAKMYEVRCQDYKSDPDVHDGTGYFNFCAAHWLVKEEDIEAAVSKKCSYCGKQDFAVAETTLSVKDYFERMLRDPTGTIGYHVIRDSECHIVESPVKLNE